MGGVLSPRVLSLSSFLSGLFGKCYLPHFPSLCCDLLSFLPQLPAALAAYRTAFQKYRECVGRYGTVRYIQDEEGNPEVGGLFRPSQDKVRTYMLVGPTPDWASVYLVHTRCVGIHSQVFVVVVHLRWKKSTHLPGVFVRRVSV
ncbi:hypothetical protein LZ32DRAFT_128879 [Colletotrichum eremochloae]|nr:hypothetical protein LZ32DRAFT_128879 [Colletotrichum eremochloae]